VPSRSAPRANAFAVFTRGTDPDWMFFAKVPIAAGALRGSGRAPASVCVRVTPCWVGNRPVKSDARLGEHMHDEQVASVKVRPVRAISWSAGVSARSQPGSSGQCMGARCWSVMISRRFGRRRALMAGTLLDHRLVPA
jgi:hypothetical protein